MEETLGKLPSHAPRVEIDSLLCDLQKQLPGWSKKYEEQVSGCLLQLLTLLVRRRTRTCVNTHWSGQGCHFLEAMSNF